MRELIGGVTRNHYDNLKSERMLSTSLFFLSDVLLPLPECNRHQVNKQHVTYCACAVCTMCSSVSMLGQSSEVHEK